MNHSRVVGTILAVFFAFSISSTVHALANRVFVSARSGNDGNACDNINTPCQTFAGAVPKLNPGGEAIVLDTGGYGPVTITQSVTIEAPPGVTAFVHPPSGDAITINAGSSDKVVLRGLVLNGGSGKGIIANTFGTLHIENCVISGFTSSGIYINTTAAVASNTFVKDTISRQNGLDGITASSGRVSIDHCRLEGNTFDGVSAESSDVTARDSVAAGNGDDGFRADALTTQNTVMNVYECMATNNAADGIAAVNLGSGFVIVRVANSSISENFGVGLFNTGGANITFESLVNNFVRGNIGGNTSGTITSVAAK